jgi:transcriptional regulator with XRE-family HTH domain
MTSYKARMVRARSDETIGSLLRRWREGMALTQAGAAALVKVKQGRWATWESGRERPSVRALQKIAEASEGTLSLHTLVAASAV